MTNAAIRIALEERLGRLQARLESIKRDVTQSHSVDSADQAQERENDEVVDAIGNETADSIREIQASLERIDNGTYGVCESCGKDIGEARQQVIPETIHCVDCAD